MELDNVWVVHALQHRHLIPDHLLVALDALLQYYLDSTFALWAICFTDNAVGTGT